MFFIGFWACLGVFNYAAAVQAPNPRSGGVAAQQRVSNDLNSDNSTRYSKRVIDSGDQSSRSAVKRQIVRTPVNSVQNNNLIERSAKQNNVSRASVRSTTIQKNNSNLSAARSANNIAGTARVARATAVFNDVSKIGGGYSQCRESYNTCMDQFCATANDTYRRCYCSEKINEFRDTENALDQATLLLKQFEDNNLNSIDKTAAEVTAMYSATAGESAIKNDTSGAASVLSEIGDLLSGKKKATSNSKASDAISGMSLDFTSDIGDVWGDNNSDSMFGGSGGGEDLSKLEGKDLYASANKQCLQLVKDTCNSDAITNMTVSAYNILISQDCNAYNKSIETKKQTVQKTVREAEKILRDARLDEYRDHNSADVNECIGKVKAAITTDTACGENYKKCLDYTGLYINATTGEPIYSAHLQDLPKLIKLDGANGNVISANGKFNDFLDDKRVFVEKALETCRDKSEVVWTEFKRSALIEIAQAQDERIEEVKSSCVSTMGECYNAQTGALTDMDTTTAQSSGALGAYASRAMCADKVAACASIYAGPDDPQCEFDKNTGKLKNTQCGLGELLAFVSAVDTVKVAEGCETALNGYAKELCTPTSGTDVYPYKCRLMTVSDLENTMKERAAVYCADPTGNSGLDENQINTTIKTLIDNIKADLSYQLEEICGSENISGVWVDADDVNPEYTAENVFYSQVFGGTAPNVKVADPNAWGYCIQNTVYYQCNAQNETTGALGYAKYNSATQKCEFTQDWYKIMCEKVGGYWDTGSCYVKE